MMGRGGAHQPRKRTLVPGGWEGRLLRRRRLEGRGWMEEDICVRLRMEDETDVIACAAWRNNDKREIFVGNG